MTNLPLVPTAPSLFKLQETCLQFDSDIYLGEETQVSQVHENTGHNEIAKIVV
ncbi:MAG: hypothetical protein HQ492_03775 [Woeseiaceae bacterium]|nr:hypothetical protein [Woeseiaceae bacterium]